MADPNNVPQEAEQLSKDMTSAQQNTEQAMADTNFDKEYSMAQDNAGGSGSQSSDPNPVNRKDAEAGTGDRSNASNSANQPGDASNSPGDSDPAEYMDMAKDVTSSSNS